MAGLVASKKPPPVFEVHFEGEGLYPEAIPLRSLSEALRAIQRLVTGGDVAIEDEEVEEEDAEGEDGDDSLRLLEVKRGSAVYKVAGPSPAPTKRNLQIVGRVLEDPQNVEAEHDYMLSPIERLSAVARRLSCSISLREPSKKKDLGEVLARIGPVSYEAISQTMLVKGDTSFNGKVERVGGATGVRCSLRVPFQNRLLYCKVADSEIARLIGQHLYQDVEVFGAAHWLKNSWRIFSFTINGVQKQPVQGSIVGAMQALREAGGKAWDLIEDPEAYLEEIESRP